RAVDDAGRDMFDIIQVDGPVIRKRVNRLQLAFVGDLEHSDAVVAGRRHEQEGRSADAGEGRVESCIKQEIGIVGDVEGVDEFEGHGSLLCLEILSKHSSRRPFGLRLAHRPGDTVWLAPAITGLLKDCHILAINQARQNRAFCPRLSRSPGEPTMRRAILAAPIWYQEMQTDSRIFGVIERLYAAADGVGAWGEDVSSLAALLEGGHAALHLIGGGGNLDLAAYTGLDDSER